MISGAITVVVWANIEVKDPNHILNLYEIIPGFLINLILTIVVSLLTKPKQEMIDEFEKAKQLAKE